MPKVPADKGVIWIYRPKTDKPATLTAYNPDGRKGEEITLRDGDCYLGLTPDGRKIAFRGKGGKLAESPNAKDLTIHLRDIGDGTEGTDTGLPAGYPVWSHDMKQVVYRPAADKYAIMNLATKKSTPLALPPGHCVIGWSKDGSWLLVTPPVFGGVYSVYNRYTLADGKLHKIVDKRFYYYMDLSPDGKTLIGFGEGQQGVDGGPQVPWEIDRFDVATGAMTRADKFAHTPKDSIVMSKWSPDGSRVVHAVRERAPGIEPGVESLRIVVCDPDGGNEVRLTASREQFMGWIYWLPKR